MAAFECQSPNNPGGPWSGPVISVSEAIESRFVRLTIKSAQRSPFRSRRAFVLRIESALPLRVLFQRVKLTQR